MLLKFLLAGFFLVSLLAAFVLAPLPQAERIVFLREVEERCRPTLCDAEGKWSVDYVRLRFSATKPTSAL